MATNGSTNGHHNSLQHYVTALTQFMEEKKAVSQAIRNLMAEASSHGFHVLALRDVVKAKLMSRQQAEAQEQRNDAYESYLEALGMLAAPEPAPAQTTKPRGKGVARQ